MNVLSLFDGMSCGQLALNRAGIAYTSYFASEIDKYAIKVTQANYPTTVQVGSVTDLVRTDVAPIDLLIGGSPCQGFSFLGKQLQFDDPRSQLFFEYVRLWKDLQPRYFLLENVRMKQESVQAITDIMGVEPIMIDSSLVSAQSRKRLYWTNIPDVTQPADRKIFLRDILETAATTYRDKAYALRAGQESTISPSVIRRYFTRSIGNIVGDEGSYRILTPMEQERLQTIPDNYTNHVSAPQRYKLLGNGWTVDVVTHILAHMPQAANPRGVCAEALNPKP
jgi:site-specific DNA-cytosine methylase